MSETINLLDLFSGIGGFSLAAIRAGFEIKNHYSSEIDKYAQWIYRKQFPGSIQLGDVTRVSIRHGKIDILAGGFPCQSFSIAGKRGGFEDTRGTLFFEIERLSRFYRPSYMVLENVKGLFSHDGGNTIRIILDKLRRLDYSVQLLLLNTVDFGIPQNRERCFFICTLGGKRKPKISHIREAKAAYTQFSNCIDANYWKGIDNHGQRSFVLQESRGFNKGGIKNICPTISSNSFEQNNVIYSESGPGRTYQKRETVPPLRNHDGCSHDNVVAVLAPDMKVKGQNGRRIKDPGDPMFTLTAREKHGILSGPILRRLTPTECERLQDYPDDYTKYGINEKGEIVEISDTQRYKTLGNSITVKPAELIMKSIKEAMNV